MRKGFLIVAGFAVFIGIVVAVAGVARLASDGFSEEAEYDISADCKRSGIPQHSCPKFDPSKG